MLCFKVRQISLTSFHLSSLTSKLPWLPFVDCGCALLFSPPLFDLSSGAEAFPGTAFYGGEAALTFDPCSFSPPASLSRLFPLISAQCWHPTRPQAPQVAIFDATAMCLCISLIPLVGDQVPSVKRQGRVILLLLSPTTLDGLPERATITTNLFLICARPSNLGAPSLQGLRDR